MNELKEEVKQFWDEASCGEELYLPSLNKEGYISQSTDRYKLEPYIKTFAEFSKWRGKRVLEIGVGLGADHQEFAEAGAELWGVDLTDRSIQHTVNRFKLFGLDSDLSTGDAESLNFPDHYFDLVYSWGVIHHSPDTKKAAKEILRVLSPGGEFKVMIYYKYSIIGVMLWIRYALLTGRPWRSLDDVYANHLESPGTKAYSKKAAAELFNGCATLTIETVLTHGDLLEGEVGQRHKGWILSLARILWPRKLLKLLFPNSGLFMLISGKKAHT